MEFHKKLIQLRNIHHMTQSELANTLGVTRQSVYKWETGVSYPEAMTLWQMHQLFHISLDILLDPMASLDGNMDVEMQPKEEETPVQTPPTEEEESREDVVVETTQEKKKGIFSRLFGK